MEIPLTSDFSVKFIINLLRGNAFNERTIVTLIETLPEVFLGDGYWIEKEVNLWDFMNEERRKELESKFTHPTQPDIRIIHPMQPDIDILFGPEVNNERLTPLTAVEVKLFKTEGGRVMPKAGWRGFYEGIGEAMALLTFGFDFVELWQLFFIPREEEKIWRRLDHSATYTVLVKNLIERLKLPLGYRCFTMMEYNGKIWLHEECRILPKKNPFLEGYALKIRSLIKDALNVEEGNEGR